VIGLRAVATPAARLGLIRALVGGYTFYYLARRRKMLRQVVRTDPELFTPVGPVRALSRPVPAPVADTLNDATLVSTALFTLGVGHRLIGPVHSALLGWTLSYRNSWSMIFHSDNSLVLHTLVLGVSRSADAVSADALATGRRPDPHPRYGWPLTLMNALSTSVYLLSGIAKVKGPSGASWVRGDSMRRQVAIDSVRKEVFGSPAPKMAYALYRQRALFTLFAAGSLVVELFAPVGLLNRKLGRLWAVSAFGMHWGIRVIMGIRFRYQLSGVSFASWFEVERVLDLVRRAR